MVLPRPLVITGFEGNSFLESTSALNELLDAGSDRAVAIVGASIIENILEKRLRERFHMHKKPAEEMFKGLGPLGTFSARINIGILTGLYGKDVYGDLTLVRKIRNDFAHEISIREFSHPAIADRCKCFRLCDIRVADQATWGRVPGDHGKYWVATEKRDDVLASPKGRFILTISVLSDALSRNKGKLPEPEV